MPRRSFESRIAVFAVLLASTLLLGACAASATSQIPAAHAAEPDTSAWVGRTKDWVLDNYDGLLRSWALADGGEEWLFQSPETYRDPFAGCTTRNFFEPEEPTHLVCFDADGRVIRVIRRGEPGWRVLPLPEPAH